MLFFVMGGFGVGWALVTAALAAGLPLPGWVTSDSPLAHGVALLLGFAVIQAMRRTDAGRSIERLVHRLAFRVLWTVGEAPRQR